jgi:hypothetical protein
LTHQLKKRVEAVVSEQGMKVQFIKKQNFRKDDRIKQIIAERGDHPGLVHVFSVVESCTAFRVRRRNEDGGAFICTRKGQCLHYYFYFIDRNLGLCYFRIATYAPFRVQFYFNGHNWLASKLVESGIAFKLTENVFVSIDDYDRAQELATSIDPKELHDYLDKIANRFIPFMNLLRAPYRWSVWQVEVATDVVFSSEEALHPIYDQLVRVAACSVKADQVADFLGRKLDSRYPDEIATHFKTRSQGTCVKHSMGQVSIKMYDKLGRVLRIETTASDVTFFSHRREVEHRDGTSEVKRAKVKRTIYSLPALFDLMGAANHRYLEFISSLDDPSDGTRLLPKLAKAVRKKGRSWRGLNLCATFDHKILITLARGEWCIQGLRNRNLREHLGLNGRQISWIIKRLRMHKILKKAPRSYRYYLTKLGRRVVAAALRIREEILIPTLAQEPTI